MLQLGPRQLHGIFPVLFDVCVAVLYDQKSIRFLASYCYRKVSRSQHSAATPRCSAVTVLTLYLFPFQKPRIDLNIAAHIKPILSRLSILHNFTIESQVQFHAPLAFTPRTVSEGDSPAFGLTQEDLTVFVNSAEWTLCEITIRLDFVGSSS